MIDAFGVDREIISKGAAFNRAVEFINSRKIANQKAMEFMQHRNYVMRPSKATSPVTTWTKDSRSKDQALQRAYEKARRDTNIKTFRKIKKMPALIETTPPMLVKRPLGWNKGT